MSKIFITGDCHGDIDFHKLTSRYTKDIIGEGDYVIVAGDMGVVWDGAKYDKYIQNWYLSKPWTTLFVDGNHENFDLLTQFPTYNWNGGKIHKINDKLFHLQRGEIFDIDGRSIFVMGGAQSTDKMYRKEGRSWWKQEMPSMEEFENGFNHLADRLNHVDYIITHDVPDTIKDQLGGGSYKHDLISNYLQVVFESVQYKHWFAGHYHIDYDFEVDTNGELSILYNRIIQLN